MLKMINPALRRMIPFNRPHRLTITELTAEQVTVRIPWRKSNLNHLKGIHALALSFSLSEADVKFNILDKLDPEGKTDYLCEIKTFDTDNNHISTTTCDWQIKKWDKVRTKV